jgi:hypothetical protein
MKTKHRHVAQDAAPAISEMTLCSVTATKAWGEEAFTRVRIR